MATPVLGFVEIADNQNNKEITHNDALLQIEEVLTAEFTISAAVSPISLTTAALQQNQRFVFTGSPSGGCIVNLPNVPRAFIARNANDGAGPISLDSPTSGPVSIVPGEEALIWNQLGDDILLVASNRETLDGFIAAPGTNALIYGWSRNREIRADQNAVHWTGTCTTAPSGSTVYDLRRNNSSVGSLTFGAAQNTGTWTLTADLTLNGNERLTLHSPANNNGLLGLAVSLVFTRTD